VRLFAAVVPPPEVLDEVAALVVESGSRHPRLRWSRRQQWHVTLAFLGEVDERLLPEIGERFTRAGRRHAAMRLHLGCAGTFGSAGRARVLWLAVEGDRDRLRALAGSVSAAARRAGVPVEDRPYRPHVTLARSRTPTDMREPRAELGHHQGTPWTAESFCLIRSRLGPVPAYETLSVHPLGGRS
jgi:2'-5' RNA ligase